MGLQSKQTFTSWRQLLGSCHLPKKRKRKQSMFSYLWRKSNHTITTSSKHCQVTFNWVKICAALLKSHSLSCKHLQQRRTRHHSIWIRIWMALVPIRARSRISIQSYFMESNDIWNIWKVGSNHILTVQLIPFLCRWIVLISYTTISTAFRRSGIKLALFHKKSNESF